MFGQSVWLDYMRRSLITSGELRRLIDEDGLRGVTSNPSIFEKAIAGSADYDASCSRRRSRGRWTPSALYERLAIRDVQDAADVLRRVYDADRTARRLRQPRGVAVPRQRHARHARRSAAAVAARSAATNLMIKVPATPQGIPAIRQLISEGINVNVTLLFAQDAYERVADAYIAGLEDLRRTRRRRSTGSPASPASSSAGSTPPSTGSLAERLEQPMTASAERALLRSLTGKVAIANAKLAYQRYQEIFSGPRWQALARRGARTQRLLWASTGTKNPTYRDVLYVEELIGPDTVNTIPPATLDAFRDHGTAARQPRGGSRCRARHDGALADPGISIKEVTDHAARRRRAICSPAAFDKLLKAVDRQSKEAAPAGSTA